MIFIKLISYIKRDRRQGHDFFYMPKLALIAGTRASASAVQRS